MSDYSSCECWPPGCNTDRIDFEQGVNDKLDYQVSFVAELGTDTITSRDVSLPDGMTLESSSFGANSVTVWLSGGSAGHVYRVVIKVTTAAGRRYSKTLYMRVTESGRG